jgi:hypothetical protein
MSEKQRKGIGAEHLVIFDILERGHDVDTPILAGSTHDMTALGLRIQVKCGHLDGPRVVADIRRPSAKRRKYSAEDVDVFAIVEPHSRRVAYLRIGELHHARKLTLYLTQVSSRTGMRPDYIPLYFDDYTDFNRLLSKEDAA